MKSSNYVDHYTTARALLDSKFGIIDDNTEDAFRYRENFPRLRSGLNSLLFVASGGVNNKAAIASESMFESFLDNYINQHREYDEQEITKHLWLLTYAIYGKVVHESGNQAFDPELVTYFLTAFNSKIEDLPIDFSFNEKFWTEFICEVKMTVMQNNLPKQEGKTKLVKI